MRLRPPLPCWGLPVGALLAVLMLGCSSLGLAPAQSLDQRLAYAYGTHTAVLQATASAQTAGTLSAADVQHVTAAADQSRALLDAARALEATDTNGAESRVHTAVQILTQLQRWLRARGVTS